MNDSKFKIGFLSFFFFFQGAFLTLMILLGIFNNKIVPTMKEKNTQIELLLKELNRTKYIDNLSQLISRGKSKILTTSFSNKFGSKAYLSEGII